MAEQGLVGPRQRLKIDEQRLGLICGGWVDGRDALQCAGAEGTGGQN